MLGNYQLLEPIGMGGMGVVYKALHSKLRQVVALKTMTRTALLDPQAVARFQREMQALGTLIHPNIIRATDAGDYDGWHYLVMEYVEGIDLNQLVKTCGPLALADACELVRQTAVGLQFIHEHQRVHRDLKPSNLMLTVTGQVKILDLGLALLNEGQAQGELTFSNQVMGTADYMAPEQARNSHHVDIRADLYSLGCTLFKLLTGSAPFSQAGDDWGYKLRAQVELPAPALVAVRPDVPEGVLTILEKLLAKEPEGRYPEPADLVAKLSTFSQGSQLTELARTAMEKRSSRANEDAAWPLYETVPFRVPARDKPGVKSAPTPIVPEPQRPVSTPASRPKKRLVAFLLLFLFVLAGIWLAWARWTREDPLPWPADYPETLKNIPLGKTVTLVEKGPWRPHDPLDAIRGSTNEDGTTFQPLWRHRLLGKGVYYEGNQHLRLFALGDSVTFLQLCQDLRRPWFEVDMELASLEAEHWIGGAFLGWEEQKPGMAHTYLLFLERGHLEHRLHLAPVAVRWKIQDRADPVYPFVPLDDEEVVTLRAPLVQGFNRVKLRATSGKLNLEVEGGKSVTMVPCVDVRGSVGLWAQKGFAYCGHILYTPLRPNPVE